MESFILTAAMQMNEKQTLLAGAAALALIVFGALFWIAPVWQFGYARCV